MISCQEGPARLSGLIPETVEGRRFVQIPLISSLALFLRTAVLILLQSSCASGKTLLVAYTPSTLLLETSFHSFPA